MGRHQLQGTLCSSAREGQRVLGPRPTRARRSGTRHHDATTPHRDVGDSLGAVQAALLRDLAPGAALVDAICPHPRRRKHAVEVAQLALVPARHSLPWHLQTPCSTDSGIRSPLRISPSNEHISPSEVRLSRSGHASATRRDRLRETCVQDTLGVTVPSGYSTVHERDSQRQTALWQRHPSQADGGPNQRPGALAHPYCHASGHVPRRPAVSVGAGRIRLFMCRTPAWATRTGSRQSACAPTHTTRGPRCRASTNPICSRSTTRASRVEELCRALEKLRQPAGGSTRGETPWASRGLITTEKNPVSICSVALLEGETLPATKSPCVFEQSCDQQGYHRRPALRDPQGPQRTSIPMNHT